MDNITVWLVIGAAVVIAGISVMLLQKKAGEAQRYLDELNSVKNRLDQKNREILDAERSREIAVKEEKDRAEDLARKLSGAEEANTRLNEEMDNLKSLQTEQAGSLKKLEMELTALTEQLRQTEEERDQRAAEAAELARTLAAQQQTEADQAGLQEELAAVRAELADKIKKLAAAKKDFADQMEEVVQSSMEKLTHAEQAKEEAIQAAQDNFEAAAEANARLKQAEVLIKKLQG